MTTAVQERARTAVSADRLQGHLEFFNTVRRDTGGPGEEKAARYIESQLEAAGVQVNVHSFDAFLSYPIRATLEVISPRPMQFRCLTHSFATSTNPAGLYADLVHLEDGNVNRGAGQAALIDGLATPVTVLRASKAGCACAIFVNGDKVIHNMIVTTIWGTPGIDQLDRLPSIPAISVNKESGEQLKALLKEGPVRVRIVTEVKTGWVQSLLPEAIIPGTEEPEKFVLVGGHYCSWEYGITDNATGDACILEMAQVLQENRANLKRSVKLCWWPGHSHGRYSGSTWYADNHFTDLAENCIAYHNIDSPGVRGATWYIARHTTAEMEGFCRAIIERMTGQKDAPIHRPNRSADQSFLANGVPAFSTYPFLPMDHPDRRPWTGGGANSWWWHSDQDTLDKGDKQVLALDTRISLTAVLEICNASVLPMSHVDTAGEIIEFTAGLQEKVGSHLDLSPVADAAEAFLAAVRQLEAKKNGLTGARARLMNDTLMRLSRVLTPVIYSQGGRFSHDPAEFSPIMRATSVHTLASLGRAAGLPALSSTHEYGFLRTSVVRERNRVVTALRDASRIAEEAARAL